MKLTWRICRASHPSFQLISGLCGASEQAAQLANVIRARVPDDEIPKTPLAPGLPHTVVSADGKFKSHALDTDDRFSFTFAKPGTYTYFCSLHPRMVGKVMVK